MGQASAARNRGRLRGTAGGPIIPGMARRKRPRFGRKLGATILFWVAAYALLSLGLFLANPDIFPRALAAGGGIRASFWGLFHVLGGTPVCSCTVGGALLVLTGLPLAVHPALPGWRLFTVLHGVLAALLLAGGAVYLTQL